jgi:large subunit ribosomal protein L30
MSLLITQVKSANGTNGRQRDTLRSLGLRGIGKSVEREDTPQLRGMVHAVRHLVTVEDVSAANGHTRPEAEGHHQNAGLDAPRR